MTFVNGIKSKRLLFPLYLLIIIIIIIHIIMIFITVNRGLES